MEAWHGGGYDTPTDDLDIFEDAYDERNLPVQYSTELAKDAVQQKLGNVGNYMLVGSGVLASLVFLYLNMLFYFGGVVLITACVAANMVRVMFNQLESDVELVDYQIVEQIEALERQVDNYLKSNIIDQKQKNDLADYKQTIRKLYNFAGPCEDDDRNYKMFSECFNNSVARVKEIVNAK